MASRCAPKRRRFDWIDRERYRVQQQSNGKPKVGYVVSAWPRLSETFILNEVISVERLGVRLRIFTMKQTEDKVANSKASEVHAPVTCLSTKHNFQAIGRSSVRLFLGQPIRFCQTALRALRYRQKGVFRCFFQATYLADLVVRESLTHLHAHFADDPTLVTMFAHYLTGIPYSLRPTPKTFTSKARPSFFGPRPKPRKPRSPARNTTAGIYRLGLGQRATANSIAFIMGWISLSLTSAPHALLMESRP